jgi:hypothetical protein
MNNLTPPEDNQPIKPKKWILIFIPLSLVMGVLEMFRAINGNSRSWVYTFEWPFFAVFIYYMYWKIQNPEKTISEILEEKRNQDKNKNNQKE